MNKESNLKVVAYTVGVFIISFGIAMMIKPEPQKPSDVMELKVEIMNLKTSLEFSNNIKDIYKKESKACQYDLSKLQGGK